MKELIDTINNRASAGEIQKWSQDFNLADDLRSVGQSRVQAPELTRLAPAVAEFDRSLRGRDLGTTVLQSYVRVETL